MMSCLTITYICQLFTILAVKKLSQHSTEDLDGPVRNMNNRIRAMFAWKSVIQNSLNVTYMYMKRPTLSQFFKLHPLSAVTFSKK